MARARTKPAVAPAPPPPEPEPTPSRAHKIVRAPKKAVEKRPTEYGTGVVGAVVGLLAAIFDITDPTILTSLIVIVGFLPAAITWLVVTIRGE